MISTSHAAVVAATVVVGLLAVSGANANDTASPVTLGPAQAVVIANTDIVCSFGGPANQIGIACLHTHGGIYSFRIDENELRGYRTHAGKLSQVGNWKQPATIKQSKSPAVSKFKVVATLPVHGRVLAAGTDLGCLVIGSSSKPLVACFKLGAGKGYPVAGSYSAALGMAGLEVDLYDSAHKGRSVFIGRDAK